VVALAWSLVILFIETFKGSNVGGPACYTDPTCGEVGVIPTAAWIGGVLVILLMGYATKRQPASSYTDKLVAVVVVVTVLVFAAAAFTFYQDHRPIVDILLGRGPQLNGDR
jgi:Mn2+/Fe2+ NRAMP family transporter